MFLSTQCKRRAAATAAAPSAPLPRFTAPTSRARRVAEVSSDQMASLGRNMLLLDDSLTCSRDYAAELFAAMIPLKKRWFSQSSVSLAFDRELLNLAMRSGCKGLFVGFRVALRALPARVEQGGEPPA